ncbi:MULTISPECIES: RHS repeat-associated core domain-containing protein [unclassified Pseudomonas]|uniref:RHS repeat-associated core domain-containing protein n=1 Tax=Pseudomonas TaxID=286 RepID=UPI000D9FFDF0|nr:MULTISPECIES: RHS repeat-associated core domain-containing protein [unclassified Pseudomonas]PYG74192.1 RHS repeat-associated protein [Pseudomonas sp. RV120224-01c]PYG78304.1 RHS repeat-associated protein [Pseudomonas sp. RV120224-01b]
MSSYFYKGQRLATKLTAGKTGSVFAGAEFVLGEIGEKMQLLLAVDRQNSIIKVRNSRCYSPYGFDEVASRESILGYNGEHRDVMSGYDLLGNGVRAYSSVLMRFCSADVLSPFGAGGINAYTYCEGDPINYLDADGRMKVPVKTSAPEYKKSYGISRQSHAIQGDSNLLPLSIMEKMVKAVKNVKLRPSSTVGPDSQMKRAVPHKFWKTVSQEVARYPDFDPQSYADKMVAAARDKGGKNLSKIPDSMVVSALSHYVERGASSLSAWSGLKELHALEFISHESAHSALMQQINRVVRTNIPEMPVLTRE